METTAADETANGSLWLELARSLNPANALPPRQLTAESPAAAEIERLKRLKRRLAWVLVPLRVVLMGLWATLIAVYFSTVNGAFAEWRCPADGVTGAVETVYCSNSFVYDARCALTGEACRIDLTQTVPILVYLSLAQAGLFGLKFFAAAASEAARENQEVADCSCDKFLLRYLVALLLRISSAVFLFVLFVMEGFALPMDTKRGDIAFAIMDARGLHITSIVASAGFLQLPLLSVIRGDNFDGNIARVSGLLFTVTLLAVAVHLCVSAVLYAKEQWAFVNSTMFLMAWEKEQLTYRAVRTLFSAGTFLEGFLVRLLQRGAAAEQYRHFICRAVLGGVWGRGPAYDDIRCGATRQFRQRSGQMVNGATLLLRWQGAVVTRAS
jgi:hypothetical protein